jgi:hypothetical protein
MRRPNEQMLRSARVKRAVCCVERSLSLSLSLYLFCIVLFVAVGLTESHVDEAGIRVRLLYDVYTCCTIIIKYVHAFFSPCSNAGARRSPEVNYYGSDVIIMRARGPHGYLQSFEEASVPRNNALKFLPEVLPFKSISIYKFTVSTTFV